MKRILIIDDDVDICTLLSRFLVRNGYEVDFLFSGKSALQMMKNQQYGLVFCDFRLGDMDGRTVLLKVKEQSPLTQVVIITGYSDVKLAVELIKAGAMDYMIKPLLPDEILLLVKHAFEIGNSSSKNPNLDLADKPHDQKNTKLLPVPEIPRLIEGESDESKVLYKQVDLVAPTSYSVMIFGESGTGKESIALRIHAKSDRKNKPFIAIDCGSLTKDLAGSELFGHEKGAFTGALTSKMGQFELANGGTVFLDEIANLPYDVQITLLRAVQERKIRRLGGEKEINIDIRIIVASNEDLSNSALRTGFREDLFHRFNEFSITIPPLRNRKKDILIFARHFLLLANNELKRQPSNFSNEVEEVLLNYSWPGNLRELNNVIKRAALLSEGKTIKTSALPQEIIYAEKFSFNKAEPTSTNPLETPVTNSNYLKNVALGAEYEMIMETLKKVKFNKSKAAQILNIDRKTLYNKLQHFQRKEY
jgi:two-component system response regulator HydG